MFQNTWQKSSYSGEGSNCVELAARVEGEGGVLLRESDDPSIAVVASCGALWELLSVVRGGGVRRLG
ncbi:DUF397 domain-containing protein [Streptomyces sp. MST-110588]|uniref:DUF397 domain-containing protein n=1 Tax=Streptomyces sp. MST-110588 TaxID=2833628 RepID=UPI001F5C734E|nr:DUF397 domain-containing protein [Streptomyces sp. MST-110588]UNO40165.1 DUF397 domain-containing protein [Streptomyces sp. MST-110588]